VPGVCRDRTFTLALSAAARNPLRHNCTGCAYLGASRAIPADDADGQRIVPRRDIQPSKATRQDPGSTRPQAVTAGLANRPR